MNRPMPSGPLGLGALGERLLRNSCDTNAEFEFGDPSVWGAMVARMRAEPLTPSDAALFAAQRTLGFSDVEIVCAALALRVESEPEFAGLVASMQAPNAVGRLTFGLIARAFGLKASNVVELSDGRAIETQLLLCGIEDLPLPGRSLSMGLGVASALCGNTASAGSPRALEATEVPLATADRNKIKDMAKWAAKSQRCTILLRGSDPDELRAAALSIAREAGYRAVSLDQGEPLPAAWLQLAGAVPVFDLSNSDDRPVAVQRRLYPGPIILLSELETMVGYAGEPVREWSASTPESGERAVLWRANGLSETASAEVSRRYRHSAGTIARLARRIVEDDDADPIQAIAQEVTHGSEALDGLARRARTRQITKDALVLPGAIHSALDRLRERILRREQLADDLGSALTARYRPGVRALMTGESGTGKTLAAHWLASQIGMPLYRADMAALTSKWIGETEKNLSRLLSVAENTDCILFFDEADALFGARTDVSDANDRHANAQTNFLLQRIEDFDGIALLSTNSRDRFDSAFVRRLDTILDFPLPDAPARARLWRAHLGANHTFPESFLDRLGQEVELAGGHIRNAVLGAALRAQIDGEQIAAHHVTAALEEECEKLGLPHPGELG